MQIFLGVGGVAEKRRLINAYVYERFQTARKECQQVHDSDIIGWASEEAARLQLDFKASSFWVLTWKQKHRIVKRKINKRYTKKEFKSKPQVENMINEFVSRIRNLLSVPRPPILFNADEAGYAYELKLNFTLAYKGERYIEEVISNQNAMTHSYTSLPLVDSDGNFHKAHLIILQEPDGEFGPVVKETMYRHRDILITCSSSGKMNKKIMAQWYREVLFKTRALRNNILLFDSFGIHKDEQLLEQNKPSNYNIRVEFIPPGTTGSIQPLDNDLNRTFKDFIKQLSVHYCKNDPRIENARPIHVRDTLCLLQVLMFNQCASPRFKGWIQHAFKKCGYTETYERYEASPVGFCISSNVARYSCDCCDGEYHQAFLRCGWCKTYFCVFHYFFDETPHYCENHIP